ncbi:hypothetical protein CHUAL_000150 [Chamberlinius hualienensis]
MMGESEIVHFECPNYLELLSEGISNLLETKLKTDLILQSSNNQQLRVHQNILSIFCPQFSRLIVDEIDVEIDSDILNLLLQFVYIGRVNVSRRSIDKLRMGAVQLGLQQLIDVIERSNLNSTANIEHSPKWLNPDLDSKQNQFYLRKDSDDNNQVIKQFTDCKFHLNLETEATPDGSNCSKLIGDVSDDTQGGLIDVCEETNCSNDVSEEIQRSKCSNDVSEVPDCLNKELEMCFLSKKCKNQTKMEVKQPLKCSQCNYVTTRKDSFRNHLDVHDEQREYVCEICTRHFRNRRRYASHVRSHKHPERLLKCERCDYVTSTRTTLTQHLASRHRVDAKGNALNADVKCAECDFVCVSKFQLRNHRVYKHSIKPFKCAECEFSAVRKTLVEKHMQMKHKNLRPFLCDTCGFRSKTISAFHSHLMVHSNNKPFKCDSCSKAYKHNYQLRAHQRSHVGNGKPFLCHICCMAFRRNYEMQVHIRHKHNDDDVNGRTTPTKIHK